MSTEFSKSEKNLPATKPWSSAPDSDYPFLSDPPVWRDNESHRVALLVTRAILAVLSEKAAMKREPETVKTATQDGAAPVFKPDPHDATQCDRCGQRKKTVRSRRVITIGFESRTVRWKFCDECAAIVVKQLKETPSEAAIAEEDRREAETDAAAAEEARAVRNCGDKSSRTRDGWMRLVTAAITTFAVAVCAAFVGGYNSHAPSDRADITMRRSPEIRRAIPVKPEIRRAIPVEREIRKAMPVADFIEPRRAGATKAPHRTWLRERIDAAGSAGPKLQWLSADSVLTF